MPKVIFNGEIVAESDNVEIVEGNYYFPPDSIKNEFFQDNSLNTVCSWKGTASYYDVVVNGDTSRGAAWYYPQTKPAAKNIENYVAFYKNKVEIVD